MNENKSRRVPTGIKSEDTRKLGSLSGREVPCFTHSQIYFDFVPPALNYFEYTMKELSSIQQSLHRIIGPPHYLKTPVSDYMSFTFVYAGHMDLTNASLALFDAEAEKQDDKENKSRIIVVYLDKDMTFEVLKEITRNTTLPVTSDEDIHLYTAVHSEQLLQDRSKLESIMATFLGKKPMVLDAYTEMKRLYNRFKRLSRHLLINVQNLYKDVVNEYGNEKTNIKALAKRLSKLRRLNDPKKIKGIKEASVETKEELSSLKKEGLIGYTMDNETLVLCFESQSNQLSKESIPNNIKKEFPKTKIINMNKLYSIQHGITSGEKLHPFRNKAGSYGTVGMIGSFRPKTEETSTMCCISSPHVISAYKTAFFRDATVLLGTCIWPPAVPNHEVNVQDISVISLEKRIQICRRQPGDVKLFEDSDRDRLDKRKVFKFGATTDKTLGFVCKTDFVLELGQPINVFLIEPYDKNDEESTFSEPGDSGAVVLTKFGQRVEAFSMVFAGDVNIPEIAKNNTIAVELKHAVDRFEHSHGKILELNTL